MKPSRVSLQSCFPSMSNRSASISLRLNSFIAHWIHCRTCSLVQHKGSEKQKQKFSWIKYKALGANSSGISKAYLGWELFYEAYPLNLGNNSELYNFEVSTIRNICEVVFILKKKTRKTNGSFLISFSKINYFSLKIKFLRVRKKALLNGKVLIILKIRQSIFAFSGGCRDWTLSVNSWNSSSAKAKLYFFNLYIFFISCLNPLSPNSSRCAVSV